MKYDKALRVIRSYLHAIIGVCTWIAAAVLVIVVLLVVSNVFGRALFKQPVRGL